jgi:hypothetical protein
MLLSIPLSSLFENISQDGFCAIEELMCVGELRIAAIGHGQLLLEFLQHRGGPFCGS